MQGGANTSDDKCREANVRVALQVWWTRVYLRGVEPGKAQHEEKRGIGSQGRQDGGGVEGDWRSACSSVTPCSNSSLLSVLLCLPALHAWLPLTLS
jgi:hypothetical protein